MAIEGVGQGAPRAHPKGGGGNGGTGGKGNDHHDILQDGHRDNVGGHRSTGLGAHDNGNGGGITGGDGDRGSHRHPWPGLGGRRRQLRQSQGGNGATHEIEEADDAHKHGHDLTNQQARDGKLGFPNLLGLQGTARCEADERQGECVETSQRTRMMSALRIP